MCACPGAKAATTSVFVAGPRNSDRLESSGPAVRLQRRGRHFMKRRSGLNRDKPPSLLSVIGRGRADGRRGAGVGVGIELVISEREGRSGYRRGIEGNIRIGEPDR